MTDNNKKDKELVKTDDVELKPKNNFMVTLILSMVILFAYKHFVEKPKLEVIEQKKQELIEKQKEQDLVLQEDINSVFENIDNNAGSIKINTDKLSGEISLQGAKLSNLSLNKYFTDVSKEENVKLLQKGTTPYFVEYGWKSNDKLVKLPGVNTVWSSDNEVLEANSSVTLTWDNGEGLVFSKKITLDDNYMFSVEQSLKNESGKVVAVTPYTKIVKEKQKPDPKKKERVTQQGAIGNINGVIFDKSYKKLKKEKTVENSTNGGWFGFTDKYWLVSSIFGSENSITSKYDKINGHDVYFIEIESEPQYIESLSSASYDSKLFAGAKELNLIDRYMTEQGIALFDKTIDFGWYYFLTKPFYYILNTIGGIVNNFGIAILILTIMLRIALFPIANKSYASMSKTKKIQPKVKDLKDKYGHDKQKLQMKLMELYKKEGVSPMGGCLPMLIQIPIFFSLYKVLSISIEMRQAPFFGWIHDLSAPDPTNIFTLFGLLEWNHPAILSIGVWPLLMGITMFLQQKINPKPEDKSQAHAMAFMPVLFVFMLGRFASGLVIYWTFSNIFAICQQVFFIKTHGPKK
jgi:YidC/Oxa1 family membrane protein insertase